MADRAPAFEIPWRIVLPLCIAASSAFLLLRPLVTDRPATQGGGDQSIGYADVPARLWQDPFRAVEDAPPPRPVLSDCTQPSTTQRDRSAELVRSFCDRMATSSFGTAEPVRADILVLPVIVPGSAYAEFAEQRLRTRVAVLSGLARCGYNPEDTTHLGYCQRNIPLRRLDNSLDYATTDDQKQMVAMTVPYEWLRPASVPMPIYGLKRPGQRPFASILVLWLNEDMLLDRPIYRLGYLFNRLYDDIKVGMRSKPPIAGRPLDLAQVQVRIIGPRTSTALRAMAWEEGHDREPPFPVPLTFVCPTATAEVDALLDDSADTFLHCRKLTDVDLNQYLDKSVGYPQVRVVRVTPSDNLICDALAGELRRRNVHVGRDGENPFGKDDVAVVAEWDTFFGRALSLSFASACSGHSVSELSKHPETYPTNVHPFVYLRGLDGQTEAHGDTGKPDKPAAGQSGDKSADRVYRPSDAPEGTNQSDYLRRIADQLAELDARLRHKGKRLKAVGVLGTDLYDKLMILRALRPQLKGVVFFTTDLDARYALPSEWENTHNLVIASGFGQQLASFYQGSVPAFRDSQQTATFAATLAAAWPNGTAPATQSVHHWLTDLDHFVAEPPRLFEVSRNGPYDLTPTDAPMEAVDAPAPVKPPPSVHPGRTNSQNWFDDRFEYVGLFAACVSAAVAVLVIYRWTGEPRPRTPRKFLKAFGHGLWEVFFNTYVFVGVVLPLTVLAAWGLSRVAGEPFSFFNGISVWPTEILRFLALCLVWYFVFRSEVFRLNNNCQIEQLFGFTDDQARRTRFGPRPGFVNAFAVWRRHKIASGANNLMVDPDGVSPREFRIASLELIRSRRFFYAFVFAIVFACTASTVIGAAGFPTAPVRGRLASDIDRVLTFLLIFSMPFFVCFTLLGALTVWRFITDLMPDPTEYPPGATARVFKDVLANCAPSGREQAKLVALTMKDFADAMDIRLIAMRTRVLGRSVYHLLFVLGLAVIGRTSLFDDWDWPAGLIIVFAVNAFVAVAIAVCLREAAETARRKALRLLEARRLRHMVCGRSDRATVVEQLIDSVQNEGGGAFKVLSQYPWLNALLLPSSGVGIWVLLEYLPQLSH